MADEVKYRWGKPSGSAKFHIFHGSMALCRKWGFYEGDDDVGMRCIEPQYGDCKACIKVFNSLFKTVKE